MRNRFGLVLRSALALLLAMMLVLTACGQAEAAVTSETTPEVTAVPTPKPTPKPKPKPKPTAEPVGALSTVLDQYYANDMFMIEMLVNEDIIITEQEASLIFMTPQEHAAIVLCIIPGVQNLSLVGDLAKSMVTGAFETAQVGEIEDAFLFGARAKMVEYQVADSDPPLTGIQATGIVNQSCYMMNAMFYDGITAEEGRLMIDMFSSINVLVPQNVDQQAQTASYVSKYEQELSSSAVKPAKSTKAQTVTEWVYLPYDYYSWWGDYGDTSGGYAQSYYEPDWNYYSDPGDYWSWGWDADEDWGFYDDYGDYYDYDTYWEYQDYYDDWDGGGGYGSDYAEYYDWALESNDAGWEEDYYYEDYSDPGDYYYDDYDYYSDPGDYYYEDDYYYDAW